MDGIKMNIREVGWKDMDWIHLAPDRNWQDAPVNMVKKPWASD
jgi:hypothetical protein